MNKKPPGAKRSIELLDRLVGSVQMLDDVVANDQIEAIFRKFAGLDITEDLCFGIRVSLQLPFVNIDHGHMGILQECPAAHMTRSRRPLHRCALSSLKNGLRE